MSTLPVIPLLFLLMVGAVGRPAGDLLAGREFLAMYMRQSRSQVPSYLMENNLVQHSRSAVTQSPRPSPTTLNQETYTTIKEETLPTSTLNGDVLTTTILQDDQPTEQPLTSQVVAVSVSSSIKRQKPVFSLAIQEEPALSAAVQRSHFSVDEGTLTVRKDEPAPSVGSQFTVERNQDGEKTSLLVRQSNGEASSHFSLRQSHSPEIVQQTLQHQRQLSQHQQLVDKHRQQVERHRQQLLLQHDRAVQQHQQEVERQKEANNQQQHQLEEVQTETTTLQVALHDLESNRQSSPLIAQANDNDDAAKRDQPDDKVEEDRREERTSFSVARAREDKSYRAYPKRVEIQENGRQEERTSFSIDAQNDSGQWRYRHSGRVYGEPEMNYEVDEAVSVQTNGRAHGVQSTVRGSQDSTTAVQQQPVPAHGPAHGPPPVKSGYVVEGQNFRKYRVEEKTPEGFIVGEYGVVSHDDGSLRGVRYTADSTINPRLIYDALVKFLSLK